MAQLVGPMGYPHPTTIAVSLTSTEFAKIALGTRARDASGNEFIYCTFAAAVRKGEMLAITSAFAAAVTTSTTAVGTPIGLCCAGQAASTAGWVQIYGVGSMAKLLGTSAGPVQFSSATTNGWTVPITLSAGTNQMVEGFYITSTGTTMTSVSSNSTLMCNAACRLNYPFVTGAYNGITS
jgi:hypothetical protein